MLSMLHLIALYHHAKYHKSLMIGFPENIIPLNPTIRIFVPKFWPCHFYFIDLQHAKFQKKNYKQSLRHLKTDAWTTID